jgi:hypothetical protein
MNDMQNNEIVTRQNTQVTVPQGFMFGLDTVTTKDIKMPIIYIAQNMSEVVSSGTARAGDIVENLSNKVLATKDKKLRVIPFYFQKTYQVKKDEMGKKEFYANDVFDGERPFEEVKDGTTFYNYLCYNFFVLVEGDESFTRYVLTFRGSRNISTAGRPMLSNLMQAYRVKKAPYELVFEIGAKLVENDMGKWFVFTSTQGTGDVSDEAVNHAHAAAVEMEQMVKGGAVVDTSQVEATSEEAPF